MKIRILAAAVLAVAAQSAAAQVRIAYIDPLSGFMGATGERGLKELQFAAEGINAKGGVLGQKLEVLPMDNKLSVQESLILLRSAIDKGVRYVVQGNGSSVAAALIDAIGKHNERNPDKTVLYLNYAAVDPDFTNDKCSFWHFRFDANSDMKMEALTSYMKDEKKVKKVYLFNQDYSFGHQVAKSAKAMLAAKRPDVQIVGDELHPLARVKDFAPYVAKIKASGADSVVTGNWGSDLALLVKAAREAGLTADFYTFYAGVIGTPTAVGDAGVDHLKVVSIWNANAASESAKATFDAYKRKHGALDDPYSQSMRYSVEMVAKAMTTAKTTDPVKVARALEGMKHEGPWGEVEMRAADHQLIQPIFIGTFVKAGGKYKYTADGTSDYAFREDRKFAAAAPATTCKMRRP